MIQGLKSQDSSEDTKAPAVVTLAPGSIASTQVTKKDSAAAAAALFAAKVMSGGVLASKRRSPRMEIWRGQTETVQSTSPFQTILSSALSMRSSSNLPSARLREPDSGAGKLKEAKKSGKRRKKMRRRPRSAAAVNRHGYAATKLAAGRFAVASGNMHMRDIRLYNESDGRMGNRYKIRQLEHVRRKFPAEEMDRDGGLAITGDRLRTHQALCFVERQGGIFTEMTPLSRGGGIVAKR